jgi:hypothetical protein
MALLIDSVRAGAEGNQELFRRALEAPITPVSLNGASRLLLELRPQRRLADLLLPASVLQACLELIEEHHRADLLGAHNLEPRHRLLLVGPPGNGTVFRYHQASVECRAGVPWR